jgi:hypothetical protein
LPDHKENHMKILGPLLLLSMAAARVAGAQTAVTATVINGKALTAEQKAEFVRTYGVAPLGGNFWYDTRSGLWGVNGREAFGVLHPGHAYGSLSPAASGGTTGVFINGRQINMAEALYIQSLLGSVVPGRWWLDGVTGNFGLEGTTQPVGNLFAIAAAAEARGRAGNYRRGMSTSGVASATCATGTVGTGDNKIDYIVGCE